MRTKIKDNALAQGRAEKKRFLARQKPKKVLADKIKAKNHTIQMKGGDETKW